MKRKKMDTAPKFHTQREEFAGELTPDCTHGPVSAKHADRFHLGAEPVETAPQKEIERVDR